MPVPDSAASPLTVLLVEDDDVDAMGVERMFKRVSSPHQVELHRAKDGEMGLAELEVLVRMGKRKVIVLLDINMPRMNGHEFLGKLRQDRSLRSTPV
ncbi:MAG: response regulator, partial [Planctomycetota bacterium]